MERFETLQECQQAMDRLAEHFVAVAELIQDAIAEAVRAPEFRRRMMDEYIKSTDDWF